MVAYPNRGFAGALRMGTVEAFFEGDASTSDAQIAKESQRSFFSLLMHDLSPKLIALPSSGRGKAIFPMAFGRGARY
jgi:hypothetical protein